MNLIARHTQDLRILASPSIRIPTLTCNNQHSRTFLTMIDTIRFTARASIRAAFHDVHKLPFEWHSNESTQHDHRGDRASTTIVCSRVGLSIYAPENHNVRINANLPKLLWGHNGRLIVTQEDFERAMQCLDYFLCQLLEPQFPDAGFIPGYRQKKTSGHFTRIDMPWHFPYESGVFQSLRDASHPKIRSSASLFKGSTVYLSGSFLGVTAYDKVRELRLRERFAKPIYRVEFRLQDSALSEVYRSHDGRGFTSLDFNWLQSTMHAIASEMDCDIQPPGDGKIADYVSLMERLAPSVKPLDLYISNQQLSPDRARRFRKKVEARLRHHRAPIPFANYFPAHGLSEPLHITMPEVEATHVEWLLLQLQAFADAQNAVHA